MKVRDLLQCIDKVAPFERALEWDNVGLMVGDLNAEVQKVGVTLDPTSDAVTLASEQGCQVLLSHHPLMFHAVKKLDLNADPGRAIREAIRNNITILAAHTNWDCAPGGVNDELARRLDLQDVLPLDIESGIGVKGILSEPIPLMQFLKQVKSVWELTHLDCYCAYETANCSIMRIALCGGAGSDFWPAAKAWGADLYLTADMKYHQLMDATRARLAVAVVDHGEMERLSVDVLARYIELAAREKGNTEFETIVIDTRGLIAPIRL